MPIEKEKILSVSPERIHEKAHLEVEGMDISGHWNRMFEQRVVFNYDEPDVLGKIIALEGGESLGWCYQCGKCVGVCPVDIVGDYGPRKIFRKVQSGIDLFTDDDLWLCTTCMNCLRVCPKEVDMVKIMPAVREQAVLEGKMPSELQDAFEKTAKYGNPLGEPARKRADWVKDAGVEIPILAKTKKPVDVLWWVECYPAYHPRGKDASRALARTLATLGVDFGIVGIEEKCVADSQRLAGEKGLFESLAEDNIKTLGKYEFRRLMVTDPHAFNAFKKEYPKHGGNYEVVHYTQLLAPLMPKIEWKGEARYKVTFHDPCYLGRHNRVFTPPREVLEATIGAAPHAGGKAGGAPGTGGVTEMPRNSERSFCCGAGGARMWMEEKIGKRINIERVEEAVATGARTIAVGCPFCSTMIGDGVTAKKSIGEASQDVEVVDVATVLLRAVKPA